MVLSAGSRELQMLDREAPIALPGDVLVKVRACGVCRTDLHILDGDLAVTDFPLVPEALSRVAPGGTVVCAGIHMSDIPSFPYGLLCGERVVRSVANPTRQDATEFLALAPTIPIKMQVQQYWLGDANHALSDLREGRVNGAAVLMIESS